MSPGYLGLYIVIHVLINHIQNSNLLVFKISNEIFIHLGKIKVQNYTYVSICYAQSLNSDHLRILPRKAWISTLCNNLRIMHTIIGFITVVWKVGVYMAIVARPCMQTLRSC